MNDEKPRPPRRPKPVRVGMYQHIREVLDQALSSSGGIYDAGSYGAAVHWRHEAYKFRKLFAEQTPNVPSTYDRLILRAINPDETFVKIEIRKSDGKFTPYNIPESNEPDDELLTFAKNLSTDIL